MRLSEIKTFWDGLLEPERFSDSTFNGLQYEDRTDVNKIGFAVDGGMAVLEAARAAGCDLLFTHHGLIWKPLSRIRGMDQKRIKLLAEAGFSWYVSHLPLDAHPEIGNNARLCQLLGLKPLAPFYGVGYTVSGSMSVLELYSMVQQKINSHIDMMRFGPDVTGQIGVVSGAISMKALEEASESGITTIVSGEFMGRSMAYHAARDMGLNLLFAGHTATEKVGVRALMERTREQLKEVECVFLDVENNW